MSVEISFAAEDLFECGGGDCRTRECRSVNDGIGRGKFDKKKQKRKCEKIIIHKIIILKKTKTMTRNRMKDDVS